MMYPMTWFQRWMLKRICRRLVVQGPDHQKNISEYYQIMDQAAKEQFTEDTIPGLRSFLHDCFNA